MSGQGHRFGVSGSGAASTGAGPRATIWRLALVRVAGMFLG